MSNPVLVEVMRGGRVESQHRGAIAVLDASGAVRMQMGDIAHPVFPRSAVKALQALPLIESGAADRFGLNDAELALACASHAGEAMHVATAHSMLAKAGLGPEALECGAHWPDSKESNRELMRLGQKPSALHNNCSGKHGGFLCVACAEGMDPGGYVSAAHPVQGMVADAMHSVTGATLDAALCGTDGCSIPTYAVPLRALAHGFARFGTGQGFGTKRAAAALRLRHAMAAAPLMLAGTGGFDSVIAEAFGLRVVAKYGAEAVYCAALPELGLGIAVKIDDGAKRAAEAVMAALIDGMLRERSDAEDAVLSPLVRRDMKNWNGISVGTISASEQVRRSIAA